MNTTRLRHSVVVFGYALLMLMPVLASRPLASLATIHIPFNQPGDSAE